jgi:hypothetical protein|nr:MAG TPA: helix-turn-helix domain protein [Caudoviricetes sp.]
MKNARKIAVLQADRRKNTFRKRLLKSTTKLVIFFGMYKSTVKKAQIVRGILSEYYEEGRQDRCKLWVYRNKVAPVLGISERTFFRYLNTPEPTEPSTQLTLRFE